MTLSKLVETPIRSALVQSRACIDHLFQLVPAGRWYDRPVPERHRLIFYLGHMEAFDWNMIGRQALDLPVLHPTFDRLFAFGIDPEGNRLPSDDPADWPSREEVRQYVSQARTAVDDLLDRVDPVLSDVCIEHRLQHAETFTYLLHNLKQPLAVAEEVLRPADVFSLPPTQTMIDIPEGTVTLGRPRGTEGAHAFGWDNESEECVVPVPAFAVSKYKVTNGEYLAFVEAGAKPPHFWRRRDSCWFWRTLWGEIPLPLDWPVYATHEEAQAYTRWAGKSLPTEAQFHRAAYGTTTGEERLYPWGAAPPDHGRGNFDCHRWNPVAVTATPLGESSFGVAQLVGNGWEWTGTRFGPFPGFQAFPFYPGYSEPFFDGHHYVLKGGSPRTAARLLRRSFRNWFRPSYPYVYAGFRCIEN